VWGYVALCYVVLLLSIFKHLTSVVLLLPGKMLATQSIVHIFIID